MKVIEGCTIECKDPYRERIEALEKRIAAGTVLNTDDGVAKLKSKTSAIAN
jgi:hypothetical protein